MWDGSTIKVMLTLIRHGETHANQEHRYLGKTEEPLAASGVQQMKACRNKLQLEKPDILLVSPMGRCRESAHILYGNQVQQVVEEWSEMDFGQYEGKNYKDLQGDPYYQKWIDSNGTLPFPQGESQETFVWRCIKGLERTSQVIEHYLLQASNQELLRKKEATLSVTAVIHGGTIMALMSTLQGGSYFDYQVANGCGYCLQLEWGQKSINLVDVEGFD